MLQVSKLPLAASCSPSTGVARSRGITCGCLRPGCEACLCPWKVPVVNPADAIVTFALLVLLGHARQAVCSLEHTFGSQGADSEQDFSNGLSMALLGLLKVEGLGSGRGRWCYGSRCEVAVGCWYLWASALCWAALFVSRCT